MIDHNAKVLELQSLMHSYKQGKAKVEVLKGADLTIKNGEIVALVGPSGSGKSTLLHIAGLLETPTSGSVILDAYQCRDLNDTLRTGLRRHYIGFIYQYHNLLAEFSALENVMLPALVAGQPKPLAAKKAFDLLNMLNLAPRADHRPMELSGGEQQRVAIARALINQPRLLLADEPTGNLDPHTASIVFDELLKLVRQTGLSALIATHSSELADRMDRKVALRDGKLLQLASFRR